MEVSLEEFHQEVRLFKLNFDAKFASEPTNSDRFAKYDPFVNIPPALLHAGHIASYAIVTGMIEPFEYEKLSKPATYLVSVEGPCQYRDEKNNLHSFFLSKDPRARNEHFNVRDSIRLAPNSVCFLTLKPNFRMPSYIGARFNLMIRDVYRGLLVGTGPLVDPGFVGKLSIPIHNFTDREYIIQADEGLVYFEFTKLSWTNSEFLEERAPLDIEPIQHQPPFPASKNKRRTLVDYLDQATGGGAPASSIGFTLKSVQDELERAKTIVNWYTLGGFVGAVVLFLTALSIYSSSQQFVLSAQNELRDQREKLYILHQQFEARLLNLEETVKKNK